MHVGFRDEGLDAFCCCVEYVWTGGHCVWTQGSAVTAMPFVKCSDTVVETLCVLVASPKLFDDRPTEVTEANPSFQHLAQHPSQQSRTS